MRNHLLRGAFFAACVCLSTPLYAQFDPALPISRLGPSARPPLPYFDIRLDADGQTIESVRAAIQSARSPEAMRERASEIQALQAQIPLLRVDDDEFFGTPHWVGSTQRLLTDPWPEAKFEPRDVARTFVAHHAGLFEINLVEMDSGRLSRNFATQHNGVQHLTFQQAIDGIDLFGCCVKANVTRTGELINVSSSMIPAPPGGFEVPAPLISPLDAIQAAAANIGTAITVEPQALGEPTGLTQKQTWSATPDFRSDIPITTELVYFARTRTDIRPAWSLVLPEIGVGNTYEIIVDAIDGEVLRRWNQLHFALGGTQDISMRVYTSDSPAPGSPGNATPNGFQFPFVPRSLLTITPAEVAAYSPNHWIDDGVNETQGNNVDAHTDLTNDNVADLPRPTGVPFRTFDFALDTTMAPSTYRDAAVTQQFYLCNRYHDRLYALGFDEVAGNFQTNNFALGGTGNDRVQADCQDGGGTNNANFGTSGGDGTSARMQMYVFTGPTPDRDGSLDADIVDHEHTHGVSIRLHNGTVNGTQSGGMGEGWGDWFGMCLNSEAADDPNAVYTTGAHTTYQLAAGFVDNYYFGIRRFPYSTDLNKNPQTYADIATATQSYPPAIPRSTVIGNTANEVHNVGEVWCVTLWECRANLIAAYGFAGNELMMRLVIDGMKLSVDNPNFLQARDAILQGDLVNNGGANLGNLWTAFAKRGMGNSATSPSGSTSVGVVEAYDIPTLIVFDYPIGRPAQLQPNQPATFKVNVSGLGVVQPVAGTGTLSYSINGGAFTTIAMVETSPNHYDATLPAGNCLDSLRYYVSSATTSGSASDPASAPASFRQAKVYTSVVTALSDTMETDLGWTVGAVGDTATTGVWVRADPVGSATTGGTLINPEDDHTPTPGTLCWFTGQGAVGGAIGTNDVDGGATTLTSPLIDMSSLVAPVVSYWRWYSNNGGTVDDTFRVDISNNNGASWVNLEIVGPTTENSGGWILHEATVASFVSLTTQMKLRFVASDTGTGSIVEAGIDDFLVADLACDSSAGTFCFGDGSLTTPCPCGNTGAAGHGCANSVNANGALLAASGTANPDTVVLSCSGMPGTAAGIYLQGDASTAAGIVFGDGLRCADGNLIRMFTKISVGGASQFPETGDPSVSTRGAVIPGSGAVRYYQTYYRNAAVFCALETFNVTNGWTVIW